MATPETEIAESPMPLASRRYIWGLFLGFSLFHVAQSIFWQFGSYYLFVGIGETQFLLIGLVGGLPVLIGLTGVYLWGSISDKLHRRLPFIIFGFLGQAISFLLYIFIQDSITFLIVTCAAYFFSLAAVPLANAYLTEAQTQKGGAVGLLLATSSLGWAVGAFSGGFLFTLIGMEGLFLLGAIAYFIGILTILILVRELPSSAQGSIIEEEPMSKPLNPDKKWMTPRTILLLIATAVAIGSIGVNALSFFFGIFLIEELAGTAIMLGLANGFASLTGFAVTLGAGRATDRLGRKPMLLMGFGSYAIFMTVYLFVVDPWVASIFWIIPFYPLIFTASYAAAADLSKVARRGRAMSTIATANSLGSGIGPIIGGTLVQFVFISIRGNMVFAAVMNIIAFLLVLLFVTETLRRLRNRTNSN
ncbi:MAG: MFS transporter [Candidatus Hermodarchaeota archaeon]